MIDTNTYNEYIAKNTLVCGEENFEKVDDMMDLNTDGNIALCDCDDADCLFEDHELENLDPSLLCPDIIMELGDTPIAINNDGVPHAAQHNGSFLPKIGSISNNDDINVGFSLTPEEYRLKKTTYGVDNPVQYTKIHCTTCNAHLGSALNNRDNVHVHSLLHVLICKDCHVFYTSGGFERDDDGSEMYCRWCGQGGQVVCCSNCEFVFCAKCIRNNLGRRKLVDIRDNDDWTCFKCDTSQLINLRVHCAEFMEYIQRETSRVSSLKNSTSLVTVDYSKCCNSNKTSTNGVKGRKRKSSEDGDADYDPYDQPARKLSILNFKPPSSYSIVARAATPRKPLTVTPSTNTGTVIQARSNSSTYVSKGTQGQPAGHTFAYSGVLGNAIQNTSQNLQQIRPSNASADMQSPQPQPQDQQIRSVADIKIDTYLKAVQGVTRINSDFSLALMSLRPLKTVANSLEDTISVYNKLKEAVSTTINSLAQLKIALFESDGTHQRSGRNANFHLVSTSTAKFDVSPLAKSPLLPT